MLGCREILPAALLLIHHILIILLVRVIFGTSTCLFVNLTSGEFVHVLLVAGILQEKGYPPGLLDLTLYTTPGMTIGRAVINCASCNVSEACVILDLLHRYGTSLREL
jgi:hypothetical protein